MRRLGLFGALALLLVVNTAVLLGAAWNRAGEPDASLRLTERELPLLQRYRGLREDTGLALRLVVNNADAPQVWLDEAKLRELGFSPDGYPGIAEQTAWEPRRSALPRRGYLVLEFDGPAWQAVLARRAQELEQWESRLASGQATVEQLERVRDDLARLRQGASRLVPVDAGPDAGALRRLYPDRARYLVVVAELRMRFERPSPSAERLVVKGWIDRVLPDVIHVPLPHRAALESVLGGAVQDPGQFQRGQEQAPRYAVTLNFGARNEPWISDVGPVN